MDVCVRDFADAYYGACECSEIRSAHSETTGSSRRVRVAADFLRLHQRMCRQRISESWIGRNSGGNFYSYCDRNFGRGCSFDDGDVDGAIKNNSEVNWNLFGDGI